MVDERVITAYHEAGHMLLYLLNGKPFRYATLTPRRDGAVGVTRPWKPRSMAPWAYACIVWGGLLSEARYQFDLDPDDGLERTDYEFGARLTNRDGDGTILDRNPYDDAAQDITRGMIDEHWALVQRYAAALLADSTVSGTTAQRIALDYGLPHAVIRSRQR